LPDNILFNIKDFQKINQKLDINANKKTQFIQVRCGKLRTFFLHVVREHEEARIGYAPSARFNKTGFRPVSRQQQDRFRNKLLCRFSCCFFATFFAAFLPPFCRLLCRLFFVAFFANFYADFFGPAFWGAFLSRQYKCRTILSMQYKSLLHVFGGWGVGSIKVFLRTACCCQKSWTNLN